jgi:hypothetical protein
MKVSFIEPVLVLTSSLLWIIVLPVAALVCSGAAISARIETLMMRPLAMNFPEPSSPA